MKDERELKYTIYKNKVYLEVFYKNTPMNSKLLFVGKNKKECMNFIKERGLKNESR